MARPLVVLLVLVGALCATAVGAQDGSIGAAPGVVQVASAQAGQTYHHQVNVQNQFDEPTTFTVTREGEAGAWTTVDPVGPVTVPAHGTQAFDVAIAVPDGTGPGNRTGQVTFTTEPKEDPSGAGQSVSRGVGVLLRVEVGGEERRAITWIGAAVDDVQVGHGLLANLTARNDGNVRMTVQAHAEATPFAGGAVAAQGDGSLVLDPGQAGDVVMVLGSRLAVGQYLVRITSTEPAGFDETLDAKVTAEGVAPDGWLRAITNPIRVPAGRPVTIGAWFESTGDVPIASARFVGQVLKDGAVVASLGSDAAPVAAHAHANLTAVWTPATGGAYRIVGHVEYDGFRTPGSEGRIEVGPAAASPWLLVGIGVLFVLAVILVVLVVRQRRRRRGETR